MICNVVLDKQCLDYCDTNIEAFAPAEQRAQMNYTETFLYKNTSYGFSSAFSQFTVDPWAESSLSSADVFWGFVLLVNVRNAQSLIKMLENRHTKSLQTST